MITFETTLNLIASIDLFKESRMIFWGDGSGPGSGFVPTPPSTGGGHRAEVAQVEDGIDDELEDTGPIDFDVREEQISLNVVNVTPAKLLDRMIDEIADLKITDNLGENREKVQGLFNRAKFYRARCFYPETDSGDEQDQEEVVGNFLIPGLDHFVQILDDFLWIEQNTDDGGVSYVLAAYENADALSHAILREGSLERDYLPAAHGVRRTYSGLFSSGLMERVNRSVPEKNRFLKGIELRKKIEEDVRSLFDDESSEIRQSLDAISWKVICGVVRLVRQEAGEVLDDIDPGEALRADDPSLNPAYVDSLINYFYSNAEFLGGIRPSIFDLGQQAIADACEQIVRGGGIGAHQVTGERFVLMLEQQNRELSRSRYEANLAKARGMEDALTKLPNRARWVEELRYRKEAPRQNEPYTIVFIDFAGFKRINEWVYQDLDVDGQIKKHHGHPLGDDVLVSVADAMKKALKRDDDLLCRYGGEEFTILIPKYLSQNDILVIMRRMDDLLLELSRKMNIQYDPDKTPPEVMTLDPDYEKLGFVRLGGSIGVSRGQVGMEIDDVLESADHIMALNKRVGSRDLPYNARIGVAFGQGFRDDCDNWGWVNGTSLSELIVLEEGEAIVNDRQRVISRMVDGEKTFFRVKFIRYNLFDRKYEVEYEELEDGQNR